MTDVPAGQRPPRPSATIMLLRDDPFEVLMVRRRTGSSFSAALVFPGGVVDEHDAAEDWLEHVTGAESLAATERALRIAALREAYEEASVFLGAAPPAPTPAASFLDVVRSAGAPLPLDALVRFGHWITPVVAPKRFDTHFYLCAAPAGIEPRSDGDETVSFEWVRPPEALERAAAGEQSLLFPTVMNLKRLNESNTVAAALAAARITPIVTVTPTVERRDHGMVVVIPEDAGYGVTEYVAPELVQRGARESQQ